MQDKLYNPLTLDAEERRYSRYFEQLASLFPNPYQIWVRKEDFGRMLVAGIVDPRSSAAVTIYLKYASSPLSNPLKITLSVLEEARNHFNSGQSGDLVLNRYV
jgi:hypothetical protein